MFRNIAGTHVRFGRTDLIEWWVGPIAVEGLLNQRLGQVVGGPFHGELLSHVSEASLAPLRAAI